MARPVKNYCDYFPHDRDMRNHRKIKAVRTKFGISGYAIWCMTLEYLTGIDGNVIEFSDTELELMSGDYGVSATEIQDVLNYCIKLELLFLKDGFLSSESLDERLKPVYDKRGISKSNSKKQSRSNGKYVSNNTVNTVVSVAEMPQSKVNKSKEEESKEYNFPQFPKPENMNGLPEKKIESAIEQVWHTKHLRISKERILGLWEAFKKQHLSGKKFYKDEDDVQNHFINWLKKQDLKEIEKGIRGSLNPLEDDARKILNEVNKK